MSKIKQKQKYFNMYTLFLKKKPTKRNLFRSSIISFLYKRWKEKITLFGKYYILTKKVHLNQVFKEQAYTFDQVQLPAKDYGLSKNMFEYSIYYSTRISKFT